MKNSKLFKRSALLLTVIALAAVLTIGAVAGVALLSEETSYAEYGEVYSGIQVSTSGKVSLRFYYSDLGNAEEFVAEITDPETNVTETKIIPLSDIQENANGKYVSVPLAPSEMTHSVKIYANGTAGAGEPVVSSVKEYAQKVLASDAAEHVAAHDAMRALLNWGAMAQTKFGDATSVRADVGLFERSTNSIYGVNSIKYEEGTVTNGTTITGNEMNLSLEPNNIAIHFYVNYTGNGTLSATVSRDGGEAISTAITYDDEHSAWKIRVANVPASLFDAPYTVTVTDGTDTFTATKTVREYLGVLLAQCNATVNNADATSEEKSIASATGNTVRAMYQLYQIVTGNTGADTCEHGTSYYYWVANGADGADVKCNYCHTTVSHKAIGNDVNAYAPASNVYWKAGFTGQTDKTLCVDEDGTQYVRFDNFYANGDNWGDVNFTNVFTGKAGGVSGQYLVVKYRLSTETNGRSSIETYSNTNKGSKTGLLAEGSAKFVEVNDNEWHTVVIDLANRVADPAVVFVDEGDGTYNVRYLSMRFFAGASTVTETVEGGRYTYVYSYPDGETTKYKTVYGTPLTEDEITAGGYTLYKTGKQSVSADAYVDISYLALCDRLEEAKTLVDSTEYEWSMSSELSAYRNVSDDTCTRHQNAISTSTTDDATVYTYACKACGTKFVEKSVPNTVNYYTDLGKMNYFNNGSTSLTKNQIDTDAGVIYNAFGATASTHWNFTGGAGAGGYTSSTYNSGEYVVIKYRAASESDTTLELYLGTGDINLSNTSASKIGTLTAKAGEGWKVAIVQISDPVDSKDGYTIKSEQSLYFMGMPGGGRQLDLAFIAVVDSLDEALTLMDANDKYIYDYGTSLSNTPFARDREGNCLHEADVTESLTATACTYTCTLCGEAAKTVTLPESVELYYSPYNMSVATNGSKELNDNNIVEANIGKLTPNTYFNMTNRAFKFDGTPYFTFGGNENSGTAPGTTQFIWMRSKQDTSSASDHERYYVDMDQAKYIVIKMRGSENVLANNSVAFNFSTSGYAGTKSVKVPLSAAGAENWGVYVVDMSKVLSTYYVKNANTGTYELDFFYFHIASSFTSADRIDLSYIAFVEDWAGVDAIVEETTVYDLTNTSGGYNVLNTADHTCTGEHGESSMNVVDGVYKFTCDLCGAVTRDTGVKADAVGLYWSAEELYIKATQTNTPASEGSSWTGTMAQKELVTEDGETFLRLGDAKMGTGGWGGWFLNATDGSYGHAGAGRYMVIKVRQNDNSVNKTVIPFWITSTQGRTDTGTWVAGDFEVALPEDNQWHVIVVDLATRGGTGYTADENGEYGPATVHMRPFGGYSAMDSATDEVMDIAYMAFFNDLNDLKDIINEETYEFSQSNTASNLLYTETHKCVLHYPTESVSGTTYTYTCTHCGEAMKEITVPESVKMYYSAGTLATGAKIYYPKGTNALVSDGTNTYLDSDGTIQVIFNRSNNDMKFDQIADDSQQYTYSVGNAKYLVIKARQNVLNSNLSVQISTTAKNSDIVTATADYSGYFNAETNTQGVTVGQTYRSGVGYAEVTLKATGDWVTYVIDLEAVCGEYYAKEEGAEEYIIDTFYLHRNASQYDVAYAAFVEGDWSDIAELTGEATVTEITAKDGTSRTVNTADGSVAE